MNLVDRVLTAGKNVLLTQDRIETLRKDLKELADEVWEHERRLIRLETVVEFAQRRGPPRVTDE